jgi:hypothetical protein
MGSFGDNPDAAQVRIEYASLLGWLGGLAIGMLGELGTAARYGHLVHQPFTRSLAGQHAA